MSEQPQDVLERAVKLLKAGDLVAVPTETVYGLAADASNPAAVARIFSAKGRPADHPLIVHLADANALSRWARDVPETAKRLAAAFWPGPLTLILKRQPTVADEVTGGQDTVGLRVPAHPLTLALLREFELAGGSGAIAAPSANRFGRISPTCADHVREELGDRVGLVLDGGPCQVGIESTIVDLSRGGAVILRPGIISAADIAAVLGETVGTGSATATDSATPRVSGALDAHYAPMTPMEMVPTPALPQRVAALAAAGKSVAVLAFAPPSALQKAIVWRQASPDPATYAHDLYACLRALDHAGADRILLAQIPAGPAWAAVADRLERALRGAGR